MRGTDTVRHCHQCRRSVYHLSKMSREEAEQLLRTHEGELCVQVFKRPDGTVVTRDCVAIRWWKAAVSAVTVSVLALLALVGLRSVGGSNANSTFSFVGGGAIKPPPGGWGSLSAQPERDPGVAPAPHEPPSER
jgi:hypothetical protein